MSTFAPDLPLLSVLSTTVWLTKRCKIGHFQWGGVNYSQTASNIRLNGTYLEADLVAINGSTRHNQSINLDDRIANINGVLEYQE